MSSFRDTARVIMASRTYTCINAVLIVHIIVFCSHASSHQFFIKSINSNQLKATACDTWDKFMRGRCMKKSTIVFGENLPTNAAGVYYLQTAENDIIL